MFGTEARWLRNISESREAKTRGLDNSHICLLAENEKGLSNLWALSSLAYEPENFYGKPQLHPALMKQYAEGIWASDGCLLSRFAQYVYRDKDDLAEQELLTLLEIFGDKFYMELHTWQIISPSDDDVLKFYGEEMSSKQANAMAAKVNAAKVAFAQRLSVPLVVVNDAHYARRDQADQHRLVWEMNTRNRGDQTGQKGFAADWMMNRDDLVYWMGQHGVARTTTEEAIKNTTWIADQCNVEIKPHLQMPRLYETDADDRKAFVDACWEGFKRRVIDRGLDVDLYFARLDREMSLIVDRDFSGYFNVVADLVNVARDGTYQKWINPATKTAPCLCGPCRGSAGGSLVAYVMGITGLDPIKHDLMFERFINPDRVDFPDIDVDLQKSHRKGLVEYMGVRYGEDKVCAIGTRSRSGPKAMLTDLAKAIKQPDGEKISWETIKEMCDLVGKVDFSGEDFEDDSDPDEEPLTWREVLDRMGGELQPYVQKYPELFTKMQEMVGIARQAGVHAAGVVVNTEPLLGNIPTRRKGGKDVRATQFDMNEVAAECGGIKNDLLSNKGLDVLAIARGLIYDRHRVWLDYDGFGYGRPPDCPPKKIITFGDEQFNDPAIWEQIAKGQTAGIFQIHTVGATKQTMKLKPRNLADVADLVSIIRPGVVRAGLLDVYLRRRSGKEEVVYDHPMMEAITGDTYGVLVYQEQLIKASRDLAGFTAGEAETLRKAIGKKLADVMDELKPRFISGCLKNQGFMDYWRKDTRTVRGPEITALRIWASLEAAGAYAFNKAHAYGYGMQACWEIWTKHYYFDEFITGCLAIHTDKTAKFISECRLRERPILPPDINKSDQRFTLTSDGIRYGLDSVSGVGPAASRDIIAARPYSDLGDYLKRAGNGTDKAVVINLILIGAFDGIGDRREMLLSHLQRHRAMAGLVDGTLANPEKLDNTIARRLTDNPDKYAIDIPDFSNPNVVYRLEREILGTYVTEDPMARYQDMIIDTCISHPIEVEGFPVGHQFAIGGELMKVTKKKQRNGREMAFLTVHWNGEDFEFPAFADAWAKCKPMLEVGAPVVCHCIRLRNGGAHLNAVIRMDWAFSDEP